MTKPSEVLQSIADVLLVAPEVRTTHSYAKNIANLTVFPEHEDAVRWCASGLIAVAVNDLAHRYNAILDNSCHDYLYTIIKDKFCGILTFNDDPSTTTEIVQQAFQKAADLAVLSGE